MRLQSGEELATQLVRLGIGARPESVLDVNAGLEVGPRGGIRVDDHMRTSDPAIFAVGDAVEIRGYVSGAPTRMPLAGPANRQGHIEGAVNVPLDTLREHLAELPKDRRIVVYCQAGQRGDVGTL